MPPPPRIVHKEPEKVAADMESLINKAEAHTKKFAVSGVVKRYDSKVNVIIKLMNIIKYIVNDLCSKHKITFIDNSCIGK